MNINYKYQVILGPHVSEKTARIGELNKKQIAFKVIKDATKADVKASVEEIFNVQVDSVRIINVKPKIKWFKRVKGSRKAWKKAYVSLAQGQDIDFVSGKTE